MRLNAPSAYLVCAVVIAVDMLTRTVRLRMYTAAARCKLRFIDAFTLVTFADGIATLTPWRVGGHAARVVGARRSGMPVKRAIVALGTEAVANELLVVVVGAVLAFFYGANWWRTVSPMLASASTGIWIGLGAGVVLAAALIVVTRRRKKREGPAKPQAPSALAGFHGAVARTALFATPLTVLSIACKVAVLPLLALSLASRPALSTLVLGSYLLVYGQVLVPTPAGAGAVELGLAGGIAGSFGSESARILLAWRIFSTVIPTVVGLGLGVVRYGPDVIRILWPGRRTQGESLEEDDLSAPDDEDDA